MHFCAQVVGWGQEVMGDVLAGGRFQQRCCLGAAGDDRGNRKQDHGGCDRSGRRAAGGAKPARFQRGRHLHPKHSAQKKPRHLWTKRQSDDGRRGGPELPTGAGSGRPGGADGERGRQPSAGNRAGSGGDGGKNRGQRPDAALEICRRENSDFYGVPFSLPGKGSFGVCGLVRRRTVPSPPAALQLHHNP